ncbi:uncharacterized protein LOC128370930 [Scomber japonicus]|uniref:uncharacterized protein LOC128370930 n=1 Tax=Scomber japonicus TaxID=13676 RepID=UPI002305071E|nr:uncharacterized protein LOC128370930 [Scomber japonicus]
MPCAPQYNDSFSLTRTARNRVQNLLMEYKEHKLGNKDYENRGLHLKNLPLLSTDFYHWRQLTDWDRLHAALCDIQAYWNMLEWKKKQLVEDEKKNEVTAIPQSINNIQVDLRDLMNKVKNQMNKINNSWKSPTSNTLDLETISKTKFDSRVEGYIILRDLNLYLTKLARDFLLLASKTRLPQY